MAGTGFAGAGGGVGFANGAGGAAGLTGGCVTALPLGVTSGGCGAWGFTAAAPDGVGNGFASGAGRAGGVPGWDCWPGAAPGCGGILGS